MMNDRVASAVIHINTEETTRLPDGCSIFRAEMYAIMRALARIPCVEGTHSHTTILLLFWNMSGTTQVSRYQKGKTLLKLV